MKCKCALLAIFFLLVHCACSSSQPSLPFPCPSDCYVECKSEPPHWDTRMVACNSSRQASEMKFRRSRQGSSHPISRRSGAHYIKSGYIIDSVKPFLQFAKPLTYDDAGVYECLDPIRIVGCTCWYFTQDPQTMFACYHARRPVITLSPTEIKAAMKTTLQLHDRNVDLPCPHTRGYKNVPSVVWTKDGVTIQSGIGNYFYSTYIQDSLTIRRVKPSVAGLYRCIVTSTDSHFVPDQQKAQLTTSLTYNVSLVSPDVDEVHLQLHNVNSRFKFSWRVVFMGMPQLVSSATITLTSRPSATTDLTVHRSIDTGVRVFNVVKLLSMTQACSFQSQSFDLTLGIQLPRRQIRKRLVLPLGLGIQATQIIRFTLESSTCSLVYNRSDLTELELLSARLLAHDIIHETCPCCRISATAIQPNLCTVTSGGVEIYQPENDGGSSSSNGGGGQRRPLLVTVDVNVTPVNAVVDVFARLRVVVQRWAQGHGGGTGFWSPIRASRLARNGMKPRCFHVK